MITHVWSSVYIPMYVHTYTQCVLYNTQPVIRKYTVDIYVSMYTFFLRNSAICVQDVWIRIRNTCYWLVWKMWYQCSDYICTACACIVLYSTYTYTYVCTHTCTQMSCCTVHTYVRMCTYVLVSKCHMVHTIHSSHINPKKSILQLWLYYVHTYTYQVNVRIFTVYCTGSLCTCLLCTCMPVLCLLLTCLLCTCLPSPVLVAVTGFFVNAPYAIITTAISADLVSAQREREIKRKVHRFIDTLPLL